MNVTKCINGHFFDADKYQLCPHCGAIASNGTVAPATEDKKSHISFFGKQKKEVNDGKKDAKNRREPRAYRQACG